MPTYEYVCSDCQNQWEEIQKISEPPVETCPKCSKPTAKRQISAGNFILKGGGWYADLYSSSKPKAESKSESTTSTSTSTSTAPAATPAAPASPAKSDGGGSSSSGSSGSSGT